MVPFPQVSPIKTRMHFSCFPHPPHAPSFNNAVAYRGGGLGMFNLPPHPEIMKVLQNRAKLNPIVKTVKNCWI